MTSLTTFMSIEITNFALGFNKMSIDVFPMKYYDSSPPVVMSLYSGMAVVISLFSGCYMLMKQFFRVLYLEFLFQVILLGKESSKT